MTPRYQTQTSKSSLSAGSAGSALPVTTDVSVTLPTSTPSGSQVLDKRNTTYYVVGACGAVLLLLLTAYAAHRRQTLVRRRRYRHSSESTLWNSASNTAKAEYVGFHVDDFFPEESATKQQIKGLAVDSSNVQISRTVLGKGAQGTIVKALASGLKERRAEVPVAVKTFHRETLTMEAANKIFVEEVSAMCHAGHHPNLVNLLGVAMILNEPAILLEYCEQGALSTFLIDHRAPFFYCHVDEAGLYQVPDEQAAEQQQAAAGKTPVDTQAEQNRFSGFDGLVLTSKELVSFAYQIARGMEYLAQKTIIHRDLASRSVLVSRNRILKISDLGLARKGENIYVMGGNAGLPVRWMPPEAMLTRCFSQSSDVWAFGVVMWEIFSLGEMPYNDFVILHGRLRHFIEWLHEGNRLDRPSGTPLNLYELMMNCWATRSADRPTFTSIRTTLDEIISAEIVDQYLRLNAEAY